MIVDSIRDDQLSPTEGSLRWIGARELRELAGITDAMPAIDDAMRAHSLRQSIAPQRWTMPLGPSARMGLMPGALPGKERFGVKILSLFDQATRGDLPSHQGVMLLFDTQDGKPLCALDAASLTALRTAAATAVATRALARPDAETLAIIGCGELAPLHLAAMDAILPLRRVFIWNRTRERAEAFADRHAGRFDSVVCDSAAAAIRDADVVCTLTAASEPILHGRDFRPGQHVNLVGSSTVDAREVDDELVARSAYFVDCHRHALSQAAELRGAIDRGMVDEHHILGEIGEVLLGRIPGRRHDRDITVYKSLGHVVQDLAVAQIIYGAGRR